MSRAIENYICASEDRPHYDTEFLITYDYWSPPVTPVNYHGGPYMQQDCYRPPEHNDPKNVIINKTIIQQSMSKEEITQLINDTIPQLAENLAEKLGTIVTEADLDAAIEEIYGGSASDIIGGSNNP